MTWLTPYRKDPIVDMRHSIDRMFELMERSMLDLSAPFEDMFGFDGTAVNIREDKGNVIVEMPLPGFNEEDIDVNVQGDILTISAETKHDEEHSEGGWYRREWHYGNVHRSVRLPAEVNGDKAKAELQKGILTITLPRQKENPVKQIAVKARKLLKGENN